ncbi:MAG: PD40 domain-containing protein [Burkholderiales bacterium]|nr:PD40 domain-containing protein [Burkholderiales bacterium]
MALVVLNNKRVVDMRFIRLACILATLLALMVGGCGGGGDSGAVGSASTPPPASSATINTYGNTNLPGRLITNSPQGAYAFELRTGQQVSLPKSTATNDPGRDRWEGTSMTGTTALRWYINVSLTGAAPVALVDSTSWQQKGTLDLKTEFRKPMLSPDGRYILSFWQDQSAGETAESERLTIFDVATGQPIKRGSRLDGVLMKGSPAAWLPDGRYVYTVRNKLYRSSPTSSASELIATLALPGSSPDEGVPLAWGNTLAVSPDGKKLALTWSEAARNSSTDTHIWVVNMDGTGLHRLTSAPDPQSALNYAFTSPTWSPDGQWVAGVLDMGGVAVAPVFPPDQAFPGVPGGIIGATGCGSSPVFVLPVNAENVPISWPAYDVNHGVKVRNPSGDGGRWVSACDSIAWIP